MKTTVILCAMLAFASAARAGEIKAGDGIGSLMIGGAQIGGHDGDLYKAGVFTAAEYTHFRRPSFGYGGEISLHVPESKSKVDAASVNRQNLNGRFLSLLATGRLNLMPKAKHTPYAAVGFGVAQHQVKETLTPLAGGKPGETKHDFWRMTAALRLGWDCLQNEKWIAGVELRYQYLDSLAQTYGAGLRLGWRY